MAADYGPVPVSRLNGEATSIFEALRDGRRVLVSRRDTVEVVFTPSTAIPDVFLGAYALGEHVLPQVSLRRVSRENPSALLDELLTGPPQLLIRNEAIEGVASAAAMVRGVGFASVEEAEAHAARTATLLGRLTGERAPVGWSSSDVLAALQQAADQGGSGPGPESSTVGPPPSAGPESHAGAAMAATLSLGPEHPAALVSLANLVTALVNRSGRPTEWAAEQLEHLSDALQQAEEGVDPATLDRLRRNAELLRAALPAPRVTAPTGVSFPAAIAIELSDEIAEAATIETY